MYRTSSNTAWVSNWTQVNLPIQINRAYRNSLDFSPVLIWTQVILGHEINKAPGLKSRYIQKYAEMEQYIRHSWTSYHDLPEPQTVFTPAYITL